MRRRTFIKTLVSGWVATTIASEATARELVKSLIQSGNTEDAQIRDYLQKMKRFDLPHDSDICLSEEHFLLLKSCLWRLKRLQRLVGYGNFHLLGFDEAILYARGYSKVGRFTREELNFLEALFYDDAGRLGFLDEKPLRNITNRIKKKNVVKIPGTGSYVYRGRPLESYKKIKAAIGDRVFLSSGIRSIMKQFLLFLNKAYKNRGNLSLASRSLAPPGYSFHGISDFDVGQKGFGVENFTSRFTETAVFQKLNELELVKVRYPKNNLLGVRFEPWHIKVNSIDL